jgi:hypothetical protein
MTKRHLFLVGLLALWVLGLTIVAVTTINSLSPPGWGNPVGDSLSPEIAGDTRIGQQFTAPLPGLAGIQVMLDRATATEARLVAFRLKADPTSSTDLWTANFSTSELQDGVPYYAQFGPLRESKGKTYYFVMESATSSPGNAIAVRYGPAATLDGASAYFNDKPMDGNLQFHTLYSLRTREKIDLLLSRMAEGRPYLLGTKGFYIGLALAYALVLAAFLLLVAKAVLEEQEGQA